MYQTNIKLTNTSWAIKDQNFTNLLFYVDNIENNNFMLGNLFEMNFSSTKHIFQDLFKNTAITTKRTLSTPDQRSNDTQTMV